MNNLHIKRFAIKEHNKPVIVGQGPHGSMGQNRLQAMRYFLKGPVSMEWLNRAGQLPGKALHTAVVLHYLFGLKKTTTVPLSTKELKKMGITRTSGYRALQALERAGLVSVNRGPGRLPKVTVIQVTAGLIEAPVEHEPYRALTRDGGFDPTTPELITKAKAKVCWDAK